MEIPGKHLELQGSWIETDHKLPIIESIKIKGTTRKTRTRKSECEITPLHPFSPISYSPWTYFRKKAHIPTSQTGWKSSNWKRQKKREREKERDSWHYFPLLVPVWIPFFLSYFLLNWIPMEFPPERIQNMSFPVTAADSKPTLV